MSVVTLSKESHKDPQKFRIKYADAKAVLGPNPKVKKDDSLPVKETKSKVAIIGGGFGGLASALTILKRMNIGDDYHLFEKHDDIGGTWYANTYPGCASDIPALWYSLSDEMVGNWSDIRPFQYEMEEYIQKVVSKYKVREHASLSTHILEARWIEKLAHWELTGRNLTTGQKIKHTSKILLNCTGGLVVPNEFNPPGFDSFQGDYMHSAIWNYDVSFKGKKVLVIGNGCSAAQVIPALLDDYEPESIVQLVRSQHWIFPPHPPVLYKLYWLLGWSRLGLMLVRYFVATVAEMRYPMYSGNGLFSRLIRWINSRIATRYMRSQIPEKFHEILIPKYKIGCKRLIFDYHYAPSLQDERIDVKKDEIAQVKAKSVILKSGEEIEVDIIVACTGYNISKSFTPYDIIGQDGVKVSEQYAKQGVSAYETLLVKNIPNAFFIGGPNSATGHSSVVMAIENGCHYFSLVGSKILDGTYDSISVKPEKYDEWYTTTQDILRKQVFGTSFGGCISWYSNEKGNSTAYPYSQVEYYRRTHNVKWDDLIKTKN